ncbi:MAG: ribonuclease HII [Candidatus Omnitrophota bacterium]
MLYYERKFGKEGKNLIIGVDEAGRGPLAGPVVAAAVWLKTFSFTNRVDDSKKLSPLQRENAFLEIIEKSVFGVGIINEKVIDRVNILKATQFAMERAIAELLVKIGTFQAAKAQLLVDGLVKLDINLPVANIIKGDAKSKSIASASIIAKVTRDRLMDIYDRIFPQYGFKRHRGYPTEAHRAAIKKFGSSTIHRQSFHGV